MLNFKRILWFCACLALAFEPAVPAHADTRVIKSNDIYVIGSLHQFHETEDSFGYAMLRGMIETIRPDVMALEVRPDEAAERKDTPGRPEYPSVVWPLLQNSRTKVVPLEPGGAEFKALVEQVSREFNAFEQRDPRASQWWSSYQSSLSTALQAHWQGLPSTHDHVTEDLARGYYLTQYSVVGSKLQQLQEQWDEYMLARATEAVRSNPDKRILILASYRNRHRFVDAIRAVAPDRLVDMERWLNEAKLPTAAR